MTSKSLAVKSADGKLVIDVSLTAPVAADTVIALQIEGEPVTLTSPMVGAKATASASLSGNGPANTLDGTGAKRWRVPQGVMSAWLEVELAKPAVIGAFGPDEPEVTPPMNQRFTLEAWVGGEWKKIAEGKTDGHGKNSRIAPVTSQKFRLTWNARKVHPAWRSCSCIGRNKSVYENNTVRHLVGVCDSDCRRAEPPRSQLNQFRAY